jgi:hypothetical protein
MLLEGSTALCIANRTTVLTPVNRDHTREQAYEESIIALEVHFFLRPALLDCVYRHSMNFNFQIIPVHHFIKCLVWIREIGLCLAKPRHFCKS